VCGEVSQPLLVMLAPTAGGRSVGVSAPVPLESAGRDSKVVIRDISVAGQPVTHGQSLPAHVAVVSGMLAPLRLEKAANGYETAPVIADDGTLYAPREGCSDVLLFSADGLPLSPLPLASLGLSMGTHAAAAFDETSAMLLLADDNGRDSKLVAVDAVSRAVRWSTGLGDSCSGIAVLPAQALVVASVYNFDSLWVHQLVDGAHVAAFPADCPAYVAACPATATLYVNTGDVVSAFRWNGSTLVSEGAVEAAGVTDDSGCRPLAVMPPTPGHRTSYLVVGTVYTPTLLVLSLSDRSLIHTHTLEGMQVKGLAADPSGTALAVSDGASEAIHVLPWPLPGMPPLQ
jgi:hypothetical protein